jgi:hypothetical protein
MKPQWALPVGHTNDATPPPPVELGRTFSQDFVSTPPSQQYCSGIELGMNPQAGGNAVFALCDGSVQYTQTMGYANKLYVVLKLTVTADITTRLSRLSEMQGNTLELVTYENILHDSFIGQLETVVREHYSLIDLPDKRNKHNILDTRWTYTDVNTTNTLRYFLARATSASQITTIIQAFTAYIQVGHSFIISAGDKIGFADSPYNLYPNPAPMPGGSLTMLRLSMQGPGGRVYNPLVLLQALTKTSNSKVGKVQAMQCASGPSQSDLFSNPVVQSLGITRQAAPPKLDPTKTLTDNPISVAKLTDWHSYNKSTIEWKYDAQNNLELVTQLKDPTASTMPFNGQNFTIQLCGSTASSPKVNACLDPALLDTRTLQRLQTILTNSTYMNALNLAGNEMSVPVEFLICIVMQESRGASRSIRFEHYSAGTPGRLRRAGVDEALIAAYSKLSGTKGDGGAMGTGKNFKFTDYAQDGDDQRISLTKSTLTWNQLYSMLDADAATTKGDKGSLSSRISPGLTQTLISTALGSFTEVQRIFAARHDTAVLTRMGLDSVPATRGAIIKWLIDDPGNAIKAAACTVRSTMPSTGLDLPGICSAYNDSFTSDDTFSFVHDQPNPWGKRTAGPDYYLNVGRVYNYLRRKLATDSSFHLNCSVAN